MTSDNERTNNYTTCLFTIATIWSRFWATVCKTVRPMISDRRLSCLSVCLFVTLMYCGQTVGRIKMKPGTQVGLALGHIVLDGDHGPTPPKGHSTAPIFGPYLL